MKALKKLIGAAALGAGLVFSAAGYSQTAVAATESKAAATDLADAEVRKVDKENKKITLKHGTIKNLDMPPMTMVFQVADAAMLDKIKPGDKVRFAAVNEAGKLMVTEIQAAK